MSKFGCDRIDSLAPRKLAIDHTRMVSSSVTSLVFQRRNRAAQINRNILSVREIERMPGFSDGRKKSGTNKNLSDSKIFVGKGGRLRVLRYLGGIPAYARVMRSAIPEDWNDRVNPARSGEPWPKKRSIRQ